MKEKKSPTKTEEIEVCRWRVSCFVDESSCFWKYFDYYEWMEGAWYTWFVD